MNSSSWPPDPLFLCWAEVNLWAIRQNFLAIRDQLQTHRRLYAVVKADAYGHGAVPVARTLEDAGCDMFCVARVEEGVELRKAGILSPILVFTPPFAEQARVILEHDLIATVSHPPHMDVLSQAAERLQKPARAHLKIDTGMNRLGVFPEDLGGVLAHAAASPHLHIQGVFSHLPCADCDDLDITKQAAESFRSCRQQIEQVFPWITEYHLANTAGIFRFTEAHFTAARSGISLYGQYPSADMERDVPLIPAMSLRTRIIHVKTVPAGTGVGYGHIWRAERESKLATVAMGYADGYPRHASNKAHMLLHGHPVPIAGRVCMDQIILDVTEAPATAIGDVVTAFGTDSGTVLRPEDVAATFGSIGYELTTRVGKRVPRFNVPEPSI